MVATILDIMAEVENHPIKDTLATDAMANEPSTANAEGSSAAPPSQALATEVIPEPANNLQDPTPMETEPMQPKEEQISKDAVKIEAQPASEGVLGYKAPGLIK